MLLPMKLCSDDPRVGSCLPAFCTTSTRELSFRTDAAPSRRGGRSLSCCCQCSCVLTTGPLLCCSLIDSAPAWIFLGFHPSHLHPYCRLSGAAPHHQSLGCAARRERRFCDKSRLRVLEERRALHVKRDREGGASHETESSAFTTTDGRCCGVSPRAAAPAWEETRSFTCEAPSRLPRARTTRAGEKL